MAEKDDIPKAETSDDVDPFLAGQSSVSSPALGTGRTGNSAGSTGAGSRATGSVTDPGSTATDSGSTATDPGSTETDPGTTATDSGSTATDPGSTETDPGTTATDSGSTATDPGSTETDPGTTATDSGSTATDPGSTATDPGSTAPVPSTGLIEVVEVPTEPGTEFYAKSATDPAEFALELRLSVGDGTPSEALSYFQTHGYPSLSNLPSFDATIGKWMFPPQVLAPGSSDGLGTGSTATGSPGSPGSSGGDGPSGPGSSGTGSGSGTSDLGTGALGGLGAPGAEIGFPGTGGSGPGSGSGGPGAGSGLGFTPAPAAGASPPSPPVPGSVEESRQIGNGIGVLHGQFLAWANSFLDLLQTPQAGVSVWDRMSASEHASVLAKVQANYASLPKLPKGVDAAHDAALRQGFNEGAGRSYESERFMARAVWALAELAKGAAVAAASGPTPFTIGGQRDCAAQTAARIITTLGENSPATSADFLVRTYGLPRTSLSGFNDAVVYARQWFENLGIVLDRNPGGFFPAAQGGVKGSYVLFFRGAADEHVIYGQVTETGLILIDDQLGRQWTSVMSAQNALHMELVKSYRVIEVVVP